VAVLLASCDQGTTAGRRDLAMLTLLARLGLRAGEVAALTLGTSTGGPGRSPVRGKASRTQRLSLPADVGHAVAGYLRPGRPEPFEGGTGCLGVPVGVVATGALGRWETAALDRHGWARGVACAAPPATRQQQAARDGPGGRGSATRSDWSVGRQVGGWKPGGRPHDDGQTRPTPPLQASSPLT